MLMASMQIEVAASSSSPFTYSHRDHNRSANIKGYIHSQSIRKNKAGDENEDSSWLPSMNSNTDDSWLPTTSQNSTLTSESKGSNCQKGPNNVDDSWLPTVNDTNGKNGTNTNELENDIDYSWLPSTFIDNNKNKQKNIIDDDKNKQKNITDNDKNKQKNINEKNKNKNKNTNINTDFNKNKNNNNNIKNNSNSNNNSNSSNNRNTDSNKSLQKKSRNNHWALAREVVFSSDPQNQKTEVKTSNSSLLQQHDSPSKSRYVVESPTSGGVSSLLQRWKDLAEVKNSNKNDNSSPSSTRNNFGSTCKEDNNSNSSNSPPTPSTIEDSKPDWESDKATRRLSCPLPSRDSKDSNPGGAEKEKIRVVDIIKKLSREEELAASHCGNGNESLPPIRTTLHHKQIEGEHKGFKTVKLHRHLIRGRQAFNNFLMQMEHDKNHELRWLVERRAVSKFSHRGRIQAMLRFKILGLGAELAEPKPEVRRHRRFLSKTLELNNRLGIMDLRERFNSEVEKEATESRKYKISGIKKTPNDETLATTSTATKEVEVKTKTKTTTTNKKPEPQSKPEPMTQSRSTQYSQSSRKDVVHKAKFVDSSSNSIMRKEDTHYKDDKKYDFYEDEGQFESARTSYSQMEDRGIIDLEETNDTNKKQALEGFEDWMTSDYSQTRSELDEYRYLDEDESYDMQVLDTNYDWISDISRPKSDWEYMRQARYQEMSLGKGDIQRLLERKSVSSFLGCGLRDLLDQLMVSHVQQSNVHVEKQELVVREKGESSKEEVEHEDCSTIDEDGDCRSTAKAKCSEYSEYVDQTPYSERSWRPNDTVYNSETATTTSPSLEQSPLSNRSHINSTPQSSSANTHRTIEMELVYDLRGHMEQLHHEIMDLRKSIKSCVNMQVKMQHSFKQHVIANATMRSVQKKERKPPGMVKHDCSICCDMQVDSLLYRCGHMCTCFKCAVELQRTSGECPVCEAPIVDVVKAFAHEN